MAQTTTASLKTNAAAITRTVSRELRIAWGRNADSWPIDWATQATDETLRLLEVTGDRRLDLSTALGQGNGPVAQLRLTLDNYDQRFSPFNEAGALYVKLAASTTTPGGTTVTYPTLYQTPVRLRMGFYDSSAGHEYVTVFTGVIDEVGENYGLGGERIQITCLDRGGALIGKKKSTTVSEDVTVDAWLRRLVSDLGGIATGATLNNSFFRIPYAWLDDEGLWGEVQQAAASDGGYAYFDETGAFWFRNAAWWATAADSIATTNTATVSTRYQDFNPAYSWRDVRTGVIVEYQPRAPGGEQVVWRSNETIVVPPGSKTIEAKFSYPVTILLDPAKPTDWLPVSSGGIDMSASLQLDIQDRYAQRAKLVFTNTANQTIFIPPMKLRGLCLLGGPQEQIDIDATTPLVPENKPTLNGNPYIQTKGQAQIIATTQAYRLTYPRLIHRFSGVPALPWLQLGDRIGIDIQAHSGTNPVTTDRYAIITGLSFAWKPEEAYTMAIEAADVAGLYEYSNYHTLGTDDYAENRVFV
jgi:hypothetical protein